MLQMHFRIYSTSSLTRSSTASLASDYGTLLLYLNNKNHKLLLKEFFFYIFPKVLS